MHRSVQTENFIIDEELRNIKKAPGGKPALFYAQPRAEESVMYG